MLSKCVILLLALYSSAVKVVTSSCIGCIYFFSLRVFLMFLFYLQRTWRELSGVEIGADLVRPTYRAAHLGCVQKRGYKLIQEAYSFLL